MADFWITHIRMEDDHIQSLKLKRFYPGAGGKNGTFGPAHIVPRAFVAELINLGSATFATSTLDSDGTTRHSGARVHVIDGEYLSTDANDILKDNLGKLPVF
ncbi:MAG: DUF3892 domain-containing protein [Pseudomonas sp.]|uniref:DUF3892 domain-containing protein n=1 Tax=Pseudomonas sp. TaxID=306 RepID=UPI0030F265E7